METTLLTPCKQDLEKELNIYFKAFDYPQLSKPIHDYIEAFFANTEPTPQDLALYEHLTSRIKEIYKKTTTPYTIGFVLEGIAEVLRISNSAEKRKCLVDKLLDSAFYYNTNSFNTAEFLRLCTELSLLKDFGPKKDIKGLGGLEPSLIFNYHNI